MNEKTLFKRIENLYDISIFNDVNILIIGCGSGGSNVALQLVMSGLRNFTLLDYDILSYENVIRHSCGIRYIGQKKIDALENILIDRNPNIKVKKIDANVMNFAGIENEIKNSTVVILATDNENSRYFINELCVLNNKPFVTARVFTRGIGGEVFSYKPDSGGCLACLEMRLERTELRYGIKEIDLVSEEEREKMYGMEIPEIKDSPGLNVDISFISCFHTRYILESILKVINKRPKYMFPIDHNYLIWGNKPMHPFSKNFQIQELMIHKQNDCLICSNKNNGIS